MESTPQHSPGSPEDGALWDGVWLPCRIIAVTHHGEIHGYLISRSQGRGRVVNDF